MLSVISQAHLKQLIKSEKCKDLFKNHITLINLRFTGSKYRVLKKQINGCLQLECNENKIYSFYYKPVNLI